MVDRIYKTRAGVIIESDNRYYYPGVMDWDSFINDDRLVEKIQEYKNSSNIAEYGKELISKEPLPPIDRQEIWAAGVTYRKSREARMEEAKGAGGGNFYEKVYEAERPELFFKANAQRTVGTGQNINIRKDSVWNVPEPELTLFINVQGNIVGYTIGNDMSSRSIEGENPLYLPQAKIFEKCAGLGPCLTVLREGLKDDTMIIMEIVRHGISVYNDSIALNKMKRNLNELVDFLYRECVFPFGCYLMTGTGMVPPNDFTLQSGDEIRITIDPIGTLTNTVS